MDFNKITIAQKLDWFIRTWLCSHIRYVSIVDIPKIEPLVFIEWVLKTDPSFIDYKVEEWLPNCELQEVDEIAVMRHLKQAESDFNEEKEEGGLNNVRGAVIPWTEYVTNKIEWAFQLVPKSSNSKLAYKKHSHGPTDILIWGNTDAIYYLEIHNES